MQCSAPPPLTDDQISQALDGSATPEIVAHLAACRACAGGLERARRIESGLRGRLRRWDCPPPQRLADYHLGRAAGEEDRAIARHLAACASCKAEIETLRLFLRADEPAQAPAPAQIPRRETPRGPLIARLLPPASAPALRGRGPVAIQATAEATSIWLDVRPAGAGLAEVYGQVADEDLERWSGALVELRQAGQLQATAEVDDLGAFGCGQVRAAASELRLCPRAGRIIVIADLDLSPHRS